MLTRVFTEAKAIRFMQNNYLLALFLDRFFLARARASFASCFRTASFGTLKAIPPLYPLPRICSVNGSGPIRVNPSSLSPDVEIRTAGNWDFRRSSRPMNARLGS
jgi:hypothetical protein